MSSGAKCPYPGCGLECDVVRDTPIAPGITRRQCPNGHTWTRDIEDDLELRRVQAWSDEVL